METERYRPILNIGVLPGTSLQQAREKALWLRQCGYSGFAINGSCAQPVENLDDWLPGYLQACRSYVLAAREQGLNVWIFDEWGYPSGCACGQVLTTEERRAKRYRICYDLVLQPGEKLELPCPANFVCAAAFPVDYLSFYSPKGTGKRLQPEAGRLVYTAQERTRVVAVGWEYLSFVTHVMKKDPENDPTIGTVDILSRETVAAFLANMHERYVPVLGDEFGKTVKGFFYDEPEICYDFPMTAELPARFAAENGYELESILPELLAWTKAESGLISRNGAYERLAREWKAYTRAWTGLLAENFYGQIQSWCTAHGLLSVGHQDLDNQLSTLCTVSGDFWKNSEHNDRPGVDVIWAQVAPGRFCDFPRFAGCAARTFQKDGAISETFAEMGPSMYPDRMRYVMEHQILRGIDQFFLYTSVDPKDPNVFHFAADVNDRVTQTAALFAEGRCGAELAVYIPMEQIAFDAAHADPHQRNSDPQLWQRAELLAQKLCYRPVDYDYAWQGTLDTLNRRGIRILLLPGVTALPEEEIRTMRAFAASGGRVCSIGRPCPELGEAAEFWPDADRFLTELDTDLLLCGEHASISLSTRLLPDQKRYFLLNESDCSLVTLLGIRSGGGVWQQFDRADGSWKDSDRCEELHFQPRELKIFRRLAQDRPAEPLWYSARQALHGWKVSGPGEQVVTTDRLRPWQELGITDYTGFVSYETHFDWSGGLCELDLGDVRFAALVSVDDRRFRLPLAPHRVRLELGRGRHALRVDVLNSNASTLYSGPDDGKSRFSGGYWMMYQFERAYRECGLLGPVTVCHLSTRPMVLHK